MEVVEDQDDGLVLVQVVDETRQQRVDDGRSEERR